MGLRVGAVGLDVGNLVGALVGEVVGLGVGESVGGVVGTDVGLDEGDAVGSGALQESDVYSTGITCKGMLCSVHSQAIARLSPPLPSL